VLGEAVVVVELRGPLLGTNDLGLLVRVRPRGRKTDEASLMTVGTIVKVISTASQIAFLLDK